jgi:hypothetical protein
VDEVSPTQSDPPDARSNNLMEPVSEGIADESSYNSRMYSQHPEAFAGHHRVELGEYAQAAKKTRAGHATGFNSDKVDLVEWAREEEEEKGHEKKSEDSTPEERTARKQAVPSKVSQRVLPETRNQIATNNRAKQTHLEKGIHHATAVGHFNRKAE